MLCSVYFPPLATVDEYLCHHDIVEELSGVYGEDKIVILGDYNLPGVQWTEDEENGMFVSGGNVKAELVMEMISYANLQQLNCVFNANNIMLDLIFSNVNNYNIFCADSFLLPCDSHHPALVLEVHECDKLESLLYESYTYDFNQCNYDELNNFLINIDYDALFDCDINDDLVRFSSILDYCFEHYVPKKIIKNQFKFPPWFDHNLRVNTLKKKGGSQIV